MSNPLYELKKDDWNRFFPIHLESHNPRWSAVFQKEKELIFSQIKTFEPILIEHVGSTSIPGIKAKPYIDILIVIGEELLFNEDIISALTAIGYTYFFVPKRENIEAYMSFGKGYNLEGKPEQIFHIHMCPENNITVKQREFRDFLRANPEQAKAYEKLKLESAEKFKNDRGAYVLSKNEFVRQVLALAGS
ncbi:GrpB family protein [Algoriphagus sp. Y33]|uniref:GrpB family protein n=1 Tax=Algoriphagus sp. Y33 TaxID=2772483 RepID=UPI001783D760|nr:GrpB family protein [Algoriphagus sp. Y33]